MHLLPSRLAAMPRWLRTLAVRPRLVVVAVIGVLTGCALPAVVQMAPLTRWLVAWNVGAWLYLALAALMMVRSTHEHMRVRASLQDDGKYAILLIVVASAVACLVAIAGELGVVKDMHGWRRDLHVALVGATVMSAWGFTQVMFALHYAHDYVAATNAGRKPGLQFPEDDEPDYGDFFYFAAIIGTSGQTADVSFTSKAMRRTGTLHCVLAYLFNTVVLAMLINIGASLI